MGEYLRYKQEGRFIGMVAAQILNPTYYFLSNALVLGELSRRRVPTAFMVMEYPDDVFNQNSGDKKGAFDPIDFIVGETVDKQGNPAYQIVRIKIRPYAVRESDGSLRRVRTIEELNGYPCNAIMVELADGRFIENGGSYRFATTQTIQAESGTKKQTTVYPIAALGIEFPGLKTSYLEGNSNEATNGDILPSLSLTDFYKILWTNTIDHMRAIGVLPSEEEMPIFYVNARTLYTEIAKAARPPEETKSALGFSGEPREMLQTLFLLTPSDIEKIREDIHRQRSSNGINDDIQDSGVLYTRNDVTDDDILAYVLRSKGLYFDEHSGLLMNTRGMLDPASYYAFQKVWPDVYLECSSCGGPYFVSKIARAGALVERYDILSRQIRLPDVELPELECYKIYPGKKYFNIDEFQKKWMKIFARVNKWMQEHRNGHERKKILSSKIDEFRRIMHAELVNLLQDHRQHMIESSFIIPSRIRAFLADIMEGIDQV
ncbi:MAG: hypothetical protein N3A54_02040 [Patescibacteria group bacterium]|nr:hypothetical protein [Patescibacteria group bacterium]